jgi:hypothetical protein
MSTQFLLASILALGLRAAAPDGSTLRLPAPASSEYVIEAEVRFAQPGAGVRLEAGGVLEAAPDEADSKIELRLALDGKTLFTETELLKPLPHKDWGAGAYEEIEREARAMPGWRERWFRIRAEVSPHGVWYWFDGRAIGEVPRPAAAGEIGLRLAAGASSRGFRVTEARAKRGGYQPVDLTGYGNTTNDNAPTGRIQVGGVPFHLGAAAIDVAQAGLRIRKKPRGPGSLYGQQFNSISAMDGDPLTILLRVPKRYYRRAWLLAAASDKAELSPKLTVRLARYRGANGSFFADSEVAVPRGRATSRAGMPPSIAAQSGRLWLIEVPLHSGALQDVLAADFLKARGNPSEVLGLDANVPWLDIELTRQLRADLNCMLPLGPQSGVRIHGVTLEESPVRMVVTSPALGHLFSPEETPRFDVHFENVTSSAQSATLTVETRDTYGAANRRTRQVSIGAAERRTEHLALSRARLGKFDATFRLTDSRDAALVERTTTYAVLPPDTRQAERDSPFGLWSWGGAHLTPPNEVEAALMRRAGARFTLGAGYPSKRQYGIGTGTDIVTGIFYSTQPIPGAPASAARDMVEKMKTRGSDPLYWQIYWEDMISDRHHRKFPPALIGRPPMELNAEEQARFQAYWDRAVAYAELSKTALPREKLALGAWPNFTEEFLRRGFPTKLLDALSLEVGGYRMQPERPPDIDDVNGLYFIQEWKKLHGCQNLDTIMVESLYHGTAPGYLSERDQANYYVRDFLLGLAYGVKLFGMSAMITDVANDYYRSNWGSVGLCHRAPEPSPKPSYVAYATMTGVLDRARYTGRVDTGSTSAYALHFVASDGENVYPMWTTRGKRAASVALEGEGRGVVIDAMNNRTGLSAPSVTLSESPVYLKTKARLTKVEAGAPVHAERPPRDSIALDALTDLSRWQPRTGRDELLEEGNSRYPRRAAEFNFKAAADSARGKVVEVSAHASAGSPLLPMYGVLDRRRPARIPGLPRRLGLWVKGNSGWGRTTFELVDAKGERWIGAGGSEDSYGHGFVNFDGWRWMEVDIPGHFRRDYPWPHNGNWTARDGDSVVDYPLSLTGIIVELRDQVVYVNELVPVRDNRIRISDLRAIY